MTPDNKPSVKGNMSHWSLEQWLRYLEQQHPKAIDMGLQRIQQVAQRLAVLAPAPCVITVAGTNGKGSTVRYLEQILVAAGHRTATYTSPHFLHYAERVRIAGRELSEAEHCQAFYAVEQARQDISLTYFEHGTLAALWLIQQHSVDVAILEIGLGGRLDAVNIVDPDVAIVTSVGVDHVEFLGNDREQIGYEKAGVYRPHKPAICADLQPPSRLLQQAAEIGAELYCVGKDFSFKASPSASTWTFEMTTSGQPEPLVMQSLPLPRLPLPNAATALAALHCLPISKNLAVSRAAIVEGLQKAALPGRLEVRQEAPLVVLDVAHNPHAASYLAEQLAVRWPQRRIRAVCGMLKDKDIAGTLACFNKLPVIWYLASTLGARGASASQLAEALIKVHSTPVLAAQTYDSVAAAYQNALLDAESDAETGDIVLCFGSFLTIQAIYELEG